MNMSCSYMVCIEHTKSLPESDALQTQRRLLGLRLRVLQEELASQSRRVMQHAVPDCSGVTQPLRHLPGLIVMQNRT